MTIGTNVFPQNSGGGGGVLQYATRSAFPTTGSPTIIYIAQDTSLAYYWNSTTNSYVEASGSPESFRGGYNASTNLFPSTGGSGASGAIMAGDYWYITVAGTLGGKAVVVGSSIQAAIDTPGQTSANWLIESNAVDSVFGRIGAVTAQIGDYTISQVTNGLSNSLPSGNTFVGNASNIATSTATNTAFNQNFETSTANIQMDGIVSVGSLSTIARADHIHASDTTKQNLVSSATAGNVATLNGSGQVIDSTIASTSITTQGNIFNGNSQLVQTNSTGKLPALDGSLLTNIVATNVTGVVAIANGGTGQTTQQGAINALTGTQSTGKYLRSDGTNSTLSTIQASDVPTLNQNTTGTASNITATSNTTLTTLGSLALPVGQLTGSGNLTEATSSVLTVTGGTGATLTNASIQVKQATTSQAGYLSNTDWNTFNSKQSALTNPVTSSSATPTANQLAVFNATGTQVTPTTTIPTASIPAFTGDIINTAGSLATTISNNAVTNAKQAQMATNTVKGNNTGSTANASDLTMSQLNAILNNVSTNIIYVSGSNGSNSNNGLSWNTAVATLAQALTILGNTAGVILIAPVTGGYSESITITASNITIASLSRNNAVNFTGTITIANAASNIQTYGIAFANLTHSGAGSLYMSGGGVTTAFSKTGSGYFQAIDTDLQGSTTTISITGAGGVNFCSGCTLGTTTINNGTAVVSLLSALNSKAITLTAGVLGIDDTTVYSTSSVTNAITTSAGSYLYITNSSILVTGSFPPAPALINVASGAFYSFINYTPNTSSTIAGTILTRSVNFDSITLGAGLPITSGGTGQTTASGAINALLPSQTSQSGKFLTTNGSVASWGTAGSGSGGELTPIGAILAFYGSTIPSGWLLCDGSTFSATTYPSLQTFLGSTTLPDLRGYFLRGLDTTGTVDTQTGRTLKSIQQDAFESHNHTGSTGNGLSSVTYSTDEGGNATNNVCITGNTTVASSMLTHSHTVTINATGGLETRPVNVAVNYIIKASYTPITAYQVASGNGIVVVNDDINKISTFTTSASGILKGSSGSISAATAGTDYLAPVLTSANVFVGNSSNVATGVALSGDATITNAGVLTIGTNAVSNTKLAQMSTKTIKGNDTGSTSNASDLTATQVTAMLNTMSGDSGSGGTKGLVPAPASGDSTAGKFLKADGTWTVPAGGSVNNVPIGTVIQNVSPTINGYLLCDGTSYNRTDYLELFNLLNVQQGTVTLTIATPCIVTRANHGLTTGQKVYFTTTGALPTALTANTTYWVNVTGANTFNVATSYANLIAGTYIATTGTQSGIHTVFLTIGNVSNATTFNVPDYRGKVLANSSTTHGIGKSTGAETHTLSINEMPSHSHSVQGYVRTDYDANDVFSNFSGLDTGNSQYNTNSVGGAQPHNNMQPTEFVYFHIKF
jgi:microcystin-dependent protein